MSQATNLYWLNAQISSLVYTPANTFQTKQGQSLALRGEKTHIHMHIYHGDTEYALQ